MTDSSTSTDPDRREKAAHQRPDSVATTQQKWTVEFPYSIAAPSFVLPAGAAENALFLADRFPEIALLFFEADACLAYTEEDLPFTLADLPVSWHVHMPLDFEWSDGLDAVWRKIDGLIDKATFLSPHAYVLHPPTEPDILVPLAARLRDKGVDPADFLVENIRGYSLPPIWDEMREGGYSACLDIGHIQAYNQFDILDLPDLWCHVQMLHIYGAEKGMQHQSLSEMDKAGQDLLRTLLGNFTGRTLTLELFNEHGLFQSLDLLGQWLSGWGDEQ
nr:cobamide remodeling phosphodiesterase CbiR [uncultured Pseudodesulfovibrio sp.]